MPREGSDNVTIRYSCNGPRAWFWRLMDGEIQVAKSGRKNTWREARVEAIVERANYVNREGKYAPSNNG